MSRQLHMKPCLQKESQLAESRSRSSMLLSAMDVLSVKDSVLKMTSSLLHRIFTVDCPVRDLNIHFLSLFLSKGFIVPGTLISRILSFNLSPVECAFYKLKHFNNTFTDTDGVVDSLKTLLMNENFIKPYSDEHILTVLLTRSF